MLALLGVAPGVCVGAPTDTGGDRYSEDDVKAAFLFHFATYVEWPADRDDDAITFAVMSAPTVADRLEQFTRERRVDGRAIEIVRIAGTEQLDETVEVLYIGPRHNARISQLLARVDGPTLLVTDVPGEAPEGSMINFQLVERRVRFEVMLPTAERAGLTLSSRLLGAAWRVNTTLCYGGCWQLDVDSVVDRILVADRGMDLRTASPGDPARFARFPCRLRTPDAGGRPGCGS